MKLGYQRLIFMHLRPRTAKSVTTKPAAPAQRPISTSFSNAAKQPSVLFAMSPVSLRTH
jgi:hypothetical protein